MSRRFRPLLLLAVLAAGGCSYVCIGYKEFSLPISAAEVPGGPWTLNGGVDRFHREDWQSGPGSWPHWPPRKDDRYRLRVWPVAADTTIWDGGRVDLIRVRVLAGVDTIPVVWAEVVDQSVRFADRTWPSGRPRPWELRYGKLEFVGEFFELGWNLPDTLFIEGVIEIRAADGSRAESPFHTFSIKDSHVRWSIVDMAES